MKLQTLSEKFRVVRQNLHGRTDIDRDCMSHHASHLVLKETVLQRFVSRVASCTLKQQLVLLHNGQKD